MSDEFVHALVGDWIGETLAKCRDKRINKPFLAAVLAFASHAFLDLVDEDYTPDWTAWKNDAARFRQDLPYVAQQVTGLAIEILDLLREKDKHTFQMRLAGILGAIAPDVIDGVYAYLNPDAWRNGRLLFPWHSARNGAPMTREQAMRRTAYLTLLKLCF